MNNKHSILSLLVTLSGILVLSSIGCSTPQERAAEADAKFKEERLKILERYQECVKQNLDDKEKLSSCEHYLKAVDAMK